MGYLTLLKYRVGASFRKTMKRLVHCEKGMETVEVIVLTCIVIGILVACGVAFRTQVKSAFETIGGWIGLFQNTSDNVQTTN